LVDDAGINKRVEEGEDVQITSEFLDNLESRERAILVIYMEHGAGVNISVKKKEIILLIIII
jgi:hypothetical protein